MNEPVELTDSQKWAQNLLQFERDMRTAEIDAKNNETTLEQLVKLAKDAISLARPEVKSLFTYFDCDKSREYFSNNNGFFCQDQNGKEMNLQPKTFVKWNLSTFSAHELLKTLYTVVFGAESMGSNYYRNVYALTGFAGKQTNETYFSPDLQTYVDKHKKARKSKGETVRNADNGTFF